MPLAQVAFLAILASLSGFLFGYDASVINDALPLIIKHFRLSSFQQGAVVSALLLGATIGAAIAGMPADHFGRRARLPQWLLYEKIIKQRRPS